METVKNVLITGITGQQGGAVARNLIDKNINLFGLSRNTNSGISKELSKLGVQVLEGDLDDLSSYKSHLENIDTVFFVQALEQGAKNEIKQGKMFIAEAKKQGIEHFVYSSVLGADLKTGVPHFDSKYELEKYIAQNEITCTILRPASFNENFLNPEITKRILKGKLVMPLNKNVIQQYISTEDIGKIAAQVIKNPENYKNKTITIATDEKSLAEVAEIFSQILNKMITYQKLPGIITWLVMGKDLRKMFAYMNKNNFKAVEDIDALKNEFPGLGNLSQWIADQFKSSI